MVGWRKDGVSFRYPRTVDGNRLDVVPPLGVLLLIPLSAVWLTWYLVETLFSSRGLADALPLALVGGVAPIAVSYGVITNRLWSRLLAVTTFAVFVYLLETEDGIPNNSAEVVSSPTFAVALFWWAMSCYLYLSRRSRAYFYVIAGKPLPEDLQGVDFRTPTWVESSFNVFALVAEWLLVLLALAVFFGLFLPSTA